MNCTKGRLPSLFNPPNVGQRKKALLLGFYKLLRGNKDCPKIQILTIEEPLGGKRIDFPPKASATYKKVERHKADLHEQLIIDKMEKTN